MVSPINLHTSTYLWAVQKDPNQIQHQDQSFKLLSFRVNPTMVNFIQFQPLALARIQLLGRPRLDRDEVGVCILTRQQTTARTALYTKCDLKHLIATYLQRFCILQLPPYAAVSAEILKSLSDFSRDQLPMSCACAERTRRRFTSSSAFCLFMA